MIKLTSVRERIKSLVNEFVADYYIREHHFDGSRSRVKVRDELLAEVEPHVKAIHEILSKPRLNIYE